MRVLFVAEQAAVAGVRVQRRHAQPRLAADQPPQQAVQQLGFLQHRRGREMAKHVAQGHVQRDVRHRQALHRQHHRELAHAGALGQDLRVAGIGQAGRVQSFLVQRGRHDAVGAPAFVSSMARQRKS